MGRSVLLLTLLWAVVAVPVAVTAFLGGSREVELASHDVVVSPTHEPWVTVHSGPVLPDVRVPSPQPVGLDVTLGKTEASTTQELVDRYAFIASQPEGQVDILRGVVVDMAVAAGLRGAVAGAVPVLVWLLVGRARRAELLRRSRTPGGLVVGSGVALAVLLVWQPWAGVPQELTDDERWEGLQDFVGDAVTVPDGVAEVEVRADVTTTQTRGLIQGAVDTYEQAQGWYEEARDDAADLADELRQPEDDETVVVLVSDRHDNIGMDPVARAVADAGGATGVYDAGDDTSSGRSWEAFSLDSLDAAFRDHDRWAVTGNHDAGPFVPGYLADKGWDVLDGEVVDGPGGARLLGVPDPRSSGYTPDRSAVGPSFDEVRTDLADQVCALDEDGERVDTLLVHDANLGNAALARGCVDLVLGGHVHSRIGPEAFEGSNGERGVRYTTGTTGGAAYSIAVGSKPRREASVTLLTYRDGAAVGLQWVTLQTTGEFSVGEYVDLADVEVAEDPLSGVPAEPTETEPRLGPDGPGSAEPGPAEPSGTSGTPAPSGGASQR
ncbi:metallophosphoesterase [Nocardioides sp. CFH 31398]|uniref:metallophosphoesterase n=1 Tax=Nocardioides sp. CFH 31398 TaxID=2919579 RepID=UPI001F06B7FD|nr:metallophosphoesterase [Nocardioides sp. CFH 31398]MCH1865906.1 metallophosphoesterase [Nocardioides sp. CFH 31398]